MLHVRLHPAGSMQFDLLEQACRIQRDFRATRQKLARRLWKLRTQQRLRVARALTLQAESRIAARLLEIEQNEQRERESQLNAAVDLAIHIANTVLEEEVSCGVGLRRRLTPLLEQLPHREVTMHIHPLDEGDIRALLTERFPAIEAQLIANDSQERGVVRITTPLGEAQASWRTALSAIASQLKGVS